MQISEATGSASQFFLPVADSDYLPPHLYLTTTPKRVISFPKVFLFYALIFFNLPFHVSANLFFVQTDGAYTVPLCPKVPTPVSFLQVDMAVKHFYRSCLSENLQLQQLSIWAELIIPNGHGPTGHSFPAPPTFSIRTAVG